MITLLHIIFILHNHLSALLLNTLFSLNNWIQTVRIGLANCSLQPVLTPLSPACNTRLSVLYERGEI